METILLIRSKMKKILIIFTLLLACAGSMAFAQSNSGSQSLTAKKVTAEAAEKETVEESIEYLESQVTKIKDPAEKRSVYIYLASLQELLAFYDDAQKSYVKAAGIAAGNGEGMPARSNEQIVLDAVRCALNNGNYAAADSYLNSAVKKSKNETIQAYIKLYTQWSALCKADNVEDTREPIVMLDAYLKLPGMEVVRPAILLTLWYITGEKKYADQIKADYPNSVEMAVVKGDVNLLPTPFWFFVPKKSDTAFSSADMEIKDVKSSKASSSAVSSTVGSNSGAESEKDSSHSDFNKKDAKWQIGFFRTEGNAKALCDELEAKGFDAYIATEKRPSGTVYYQVLVNEDEKGTVADRLRSAGYDCCLL